MPSYDTALHDDWFPSGWNTITPLDGLAVAFLLSTAAAYELTGTIDEVSAEIGEAAWALPGGGLDAKLTWEPPAGEYDDDDDEPYADVVAAAWAARTGFEEALAAAGLPCPVTRRDLVEVFVRLGVAEPADGARGRGWSMPDRLPLPEDVLPLPAGPRARIDRLRRSTALEPLATAIVRHLSDDLGEPDDLLTSIDRLAAATGLEAECVRSALAYLTEDGDALVHRGDPASPVDPATLAGHRRFRLVMNWEQYHETHMIIHHVDR